MTFVSTAVEKYNDAGMWLWVQAQGGGGGMPGSNLQPTAPPGVDEKVNTLLNWAQWVCFAIALLGALAAITGVILSRREGNSDEVTSNTIRVGLGVAALAGVGGLFSWFAS
ncbi:hypothetical protein [Corynebacterium auriscanis]|uniref:hypothetical protein n=1 Tax=Corynebacterium auriscanis TaxID=99807 RepID=UPI003CFB9B4C